MQLQKRAQARGGADCYSLLQYKLAWLQLQWFRTAARTLVHLAYSTLHGIVTNAFLVHQSFC